MNRWLGTLDTTPIPPTAPAPPGGGPHPCCVEYAQVVRCDGQTDELSCPVCDSTFTQPCSDADLLPIAAGEPR